MSPISVVLWFTAIFYLALLMIVGILSLRLYILAHSKIHGMLDDPAVMAARSMMILLKTIGAQDLKGMSKEEIGNITMVKAGAYGLADRAGKAAAANFVGGGGGGGGGGVLGDGNELVNTLLQLADASPKIMSAINSIKGNVGGLLGAGTGGGGAPPGEVWPK